MKTEGRSRITGPAMLAATSILTPPKIRFGRIGNVRLPRTVSLANAVMFGVAALGGLAIGLPLGGVSGMVIVAGLLFVLGLAVVNFQPLRGESMLTYITLRVQDTRRRRLMVDGEEVHVYIGVSPLTEVQLGAYTLLPGAVPVVPGSVDERGAFTDLGPAGPDPDE